MYLTTILTLSMTLWSNTVIIFLLHTLRNWGIELLSDWFEAANKEQNLYLDPGVCIQSQHFFPAVLCSLNSFFQNTVWIISHGFIEL